MGKGNKYIRFKTENELFESGAYRNPGRANIWFPGFEYFIPAQLHSYLGQRLRLEDIHFGVPTYLQIGGVGEKWVIESWMLTEDSW